MINTYVLQKKAIEEVKAIQVDDQRIMRMVQYFSEEATHVLSDLSTIEHQRSVLEAIYQMAGKAIGKL
ncbi:hypothetical protein LOZ80_37920 [Paenibacillus sp. HWE-109]|uniref:hypothetical protein n=1 Tax=Paenibacillus sp. HWE-109 TaxID=1306526 RepID=UPI001EDDD9B7|nr:hypothetical protein [Paenibacillus sp. HWE-109]UKS27170.1 hypothetical protein LOZ80_37920 [Paenibacillus sp. HWE-109]